MKTTLIAATIAGITTAFTAQAQECIPYDQLQEQWSSINTSQVFQGLSDRGTLVQVFENTDNGRWSVFIVPPEQPRVACLADQGHASDSAHSEFTSTAPAL